MQQDFRAWLCLCLLLTDIFCFPEGGTAQLTEKPENVKKIEQQDDPTIATLRKILISKRELQDEIDQATAELQAAQSEERQLLVRKRIQELYARMENLEQDFASVATGIDLMKVTSELSESLDWQQELQELLRPILEELKNLTARPRELEKLRNEIAHYENIILLMEKALANVQQNLKSSSAALLKKELAELQDTLENRRQEYGSQLATARSQLEEKLADEQSVVTTVQNVFRHFFRSRGLNLLLSLLAFIAVFFGMRFLQRSLYKTVSFDQTEKKPFYLRLIGILYYFLTFLAATSALLLVLYISGDWVLLGLALIFLFGVAWTGKHTLPQFWEQIKLFLNLSTVREGERVMFRGLPWKVLSLNIYTKLHNPDLKGGLIRLPLGELLGLHSRPFHKDEPWFPCEEGDFILLADGTYGKVLMQTPETVQMQTLISHKTYLTPDFLQLSPLNLSRDFVIHTTFGVDYQHQPVVTQQIPTTLKRILIDSLREQGYEQTLRSIKVEFKEAGASSLDLAILAEFSGQAAKDYYVLFRAIQRIAVDACNRHDWIIPFTQVMVHAPDLLRQHDHTE